MIEVSASLEHFKTLEVSLQFLRQHFHKLPFVGILRKRGVSIVDFSFLITIVFDIFPARFWYVASLVDKMHPSKTMASI